jgi:uncharacterized integral membrane protein (TIGR00698 family)
MSGVAAASPVSEPVSAPASLVPGVVAAAAIALVATAAGGYVSVIGAPVLAIVIGLVVANFVPTADVLQPGLRFTSKYVLQASIVVLGLGLSLGQVVSIGAGSLPVLVGTLLSALIMAWFAGRALRLRRDVTTLIGVGTAICGASAIAATDAVIDADEADVSYAVTTIFLFNVVAVIAYPVLGHLAGLSQHAFGLFAGTAVNDTSSVMATTGGYGHQAAAYGLVVKLTRTLAIIPVCVALAAWRRGRLGVAAPGQGEGGAVVGARPGPSPAWRTVLPVFLLGFLAAVLANSLGLVPGPWHGSVARVATWMITVALAAIGLSSRLGQIRQAGFRPILLGAILWATVALSSLALQLATGTR